MKYRYRIITYFTGQITVFPHTEISIYLSMKQE